MKIHDEILAEQKQSKRCGLGDVLKALDDETREGVCEALHDPSLQSTAITRWMRKQGYEVNRWQIMNCRKCCECGAVPDGA